MANVAQHRGILVASLACLAAAVVIFALAVTGLLFARATPPGDVGLYSVTVVLVGFGVGGLLLRAAKRREAARRAY